ARRGGQGGRRRPQAVRSLPARVSLGQPTVRYGQVVAAQRLESRRGPDRGLSARRLIRMGSCDSSNEAPPTREVPRLFSPSPCPLDGRYILIEIAPPVQRLEAGTQGPAEPVRYEPLRSRKDSE